MRKISMKKKFNIFLVIQKYKYKLNPFSWLFTDKFESISLNSLINSLINK